MATTRASAIRRQAIVAVVLAIAAVGLVIYLTLQPDGESAEGGPPASTPEEVNPNAQQSYGPLDELPRREPNDPLSLGATDAPVTMVAYSDYRCPYCAKFSTDTEPKLVDQYVKSGVLRIEWRDMPIFGEQSISAAKAGRAAAAQGKFWEFNRTVFQHAPDRGHADLTESTLVRYAKQAGVDDIERFRQELTGDRYDAAVRKDSSEATSIGVTSTPAFVINGQPVLGAQPIDEFTSVIDAAAEQAGK
ncbi:protein-disulfide isomerase [Tamaricihabitans halophyticus]|uniref:Protein-disulfide isomerase n=1 Tax=Tamaricihabitans halophyticus TaxID=1262583 RepID=A0A4R2QN37_9PSEU|nr:thioredoxin domain-containing protein [Tamaricihabitans halophyticus]TCP50008.1 protein-disulfide isomerase [Tamaricihabitans halophyticus]